jgi:hypothetical protein
MMPPNINKDRQVIYIVMTTEAPQPLQATIYSGQEIYCMPCIEQRNFRMAVGDVRNPHAFPSRLTITLTYAMYRPPLGCRYMIL